MRKLRWVFIGISFLVFLGALFLFFNGDAPPAGNERLYAKEDLEFFIAAVSRAGFLECDGQRLSAADVLSLRLDRELELAADEQTAFEFVFQGYFFSALPGSTIHYTPQTKDLLLRQGDFFWQRQDATRHAEVTFAGPDNFLQLSASGRIRMRNNLLEIWNFASQLDFRWNKTAYHLRPQQKIVFSSQRNARIIDLSPGPAMISPEDAQIVVSQPADLLVRFQWKNIAGAKSYLMRIYSSPLREKILLTRVVTSNALTVDITPFWKDNLLFWNVSSFDPNGEVESEPSPLGRIAIRGRVLTTRQADQPPRLEIKSLSVSGNMVLIKGIVDAEAQLFIDDEPIKLDSDGKFLHTISYSIIGVKTITFRAVGPTGLESVVSRQVTVFEEVSE